MTVLVSGGSGHVGGNLVRQLLDDGYEVRCLVRKDVRALEGLNVEFVKGDLTDTSTLIPAMKDIDVVFHAAAYVGVERSDIPLMERINVGGTNAMCQAAIDAEVDRFIHFSSVHAFKQRPTNEPLTESRPLQHSPRAAPYDRTKAAAQKVVLSACEAGLSATILHPTGVIGPNDWKPSRMGQVLIDMWKGKMPVILNTGFNWVDVRDVCASAISSVANGKSGQHYILPGSWGSMRELANAVEISGGAKASKFSAPFFTAYAALPFAAIRAKLSGKRPSFSRGSLHALAVQCRDIPGELAAEDLGHKPRPLEYTISDTMHWMKEHGAV